MRALITGASSGIGRDIAKELSQKGYDLILVARNLEKLNEVKEKLGSYLHQLFIVSKVEYTTDGEEVVVEKSTGEKCNRCWNYVDHLNGDICDRCHNIINS